MVCVCFDMFSNISKWICNALKWFQHVFELCPPYACFIFAVFLPYFQCNPPRAAALLYFLRWITPEALQPNSGFPTMSDQPLKRNANPKFAKSIERKTISYRKNRKNVFVSFCVMFGPFVW